jgi:hypothetical protein
MSARGARWPMHPVLAVIAKAPVAGHSKTRLSPPLSPAAAAAIAEAALTDTLAAVGATDAPRKVLVLEGSPGPWLPSGIEVLAQRGGGLDERLANAFADIAAPALVIGMDTPQVQPDVLEAALARLRVAEAVIGPASDGGYWAIGLRSPDPRALVGVPMSTGSTFAAQLERLRALGLAVAELQELRDVDTYRDALVVAGDAPLTRFAAVLATTAPAAHAA